ncbi:Nuclear transport factor 2 [Penicillium expansum]|uniref:Nuclear transport factor 2 n=1 Tax=Penicillium expansum TaxID=27334 RepID=A0A0A2KXW4_PENEN|nr:Nuclear transport factor 2 [Penicillium expansum]KGO47707.1 Nuclear transport factor 2 [Penicillium expansum]KGO52005.1 Nuclear transport factor 2 [Penicillium expansum]KGO71783.1 Nuclear transport factor 2 [Penicillium expansum]
MYIHLELLIRIKIRFLDTPEVKTSAIEWLQQYHAAGDALNPDVSVPKFYTTDCVMRFPGQPPLQGHDAIKGFFKMQFSLLDSMTHTIGHVDVLPDRIYQEAKIDYVVKGDPEQKVIKIDGLAVFGRRVGEERMSFFTVYLDPRPLLERKQMVAAMGH